MQILRANRTPFWPQIFSARFALVFIFLWVVESLFVDRHLIVERAVLGGFDAAAETLERRAAGHTVIVGITGADVDRHFGAQRPLPASALLGAIDTLLRHRPSVLVVDVFTDDSAYLSNELAEHIPLSDSVVWAVAVDSASSEVYPVLGGIANPPGETGLALFVGDGDHMVRTLRPSFEAPSAPGGHVASLPLAAARACEKVDVACAPDRGIADDTSSLAIREYTRDPPLYVLGDILASSPPSKASASALTGKIVVLGFIDGSDQLFTPAGAVPGVKVVADAVETLLDPRGPIRRLPFAWELVTKIAVAVLVTALHHYFVPRLASLLNLALLISLFPLSTALHRLGYWANYVGLALGFWIEQLYEGVTEREAVKAPGEAASEAAAPAG